MNTNAYKFNKSSWNMAIISCVSFYAHIDSNSEGIIPDNTLKV